MANNNVISFEHSAEQAQKRLRGNNAQRVVNGIRERLDQTLPYLMQDLFEDLDDELYALSDRSVSDVMQTQYFGAMRELRRLRQSIEQGFIQEVLGQYDRFWNDPGAFLSASAESSEAAAEEEMSLVENDDLERNLAVSTMVSKAENRFHQALFMLNKRLAFVAAVEEISSSTSPIGPRVLAESFAKALSVWNGETIVSLVVFKLFDRDVLSYIGGLYDEINDLFVDNNILPKISRKIRRNPVAPSVQRARDPESDYAPPTTGDDRPDDSFLRELASLVAERRQTNLDESGYTHWYDRSAAASHLPQVSTGELLTALGAVQQVSMNQAPVDTESLREMQAELMESLGRELDVGSLEQPIKRLGDNDRNLIDVMGMLFDFILDDENLPESMKALLGRLQIPLLKVGLQDRRFFNDRQHPARQLLNTLARAALAWTDDGDRSQNSTYGQIESAVMRVLTDFNDDVAVFEEVNKQFKAYLEREQRNAKAAEQRLVQARDGQESLQQAKQRVAEQLEQIIAACNSAGCRLPEVVEQLLATGWRDVMLLTLLREGEDSSAWSHVVELARQLIWSVQPKQEVAERQRLLKAIPGLLKSLRDGLSNISFDQHRASAMFRELQACHIMALRGDPVMPASTPEKSTPLHQAQQQHSGKETTATEEGVDAVQHDEYCEEALRIPIGTWMEWTNDEGMRVRGKLSWRSEHSGNSVFVDRRGIKLAELELADFAGMMRCGNARILDNMDSPLMDRALHAMMDALKRTAPENRAN